MPTSPIRARSGGSGQGQRASKLLARRDGDELEISEDVPGSACFEGRLGEPRGVPAGSGIWRSDGSRPDELRTRLGDERSHAGFGT